MNNTISEAPNELFDWLRNFNFSELNEKQKLEVLRFMNEAEYHAMRVATQIIAEADPQVYAASRKTELLSAFGKQQQLRRKKKAVVYWQAAAALLCLLSGWLFYKVHILNNNRLPDLLTQCDTVYIEKNAPVQVVTQYDTVYLNPYALKKNKTKTVSSSPESFTDQTPDFSINTIEVMTVGHHQKIINTAGRNSMKTDSLNRKLGFVSL